jgi:hypothetical protein
MPFSTTTSHGVTRRLMGALAFAACALFSTSGSAQAGVLSFEQDQGTPLAFSGATYAFGDYWMQTLGDGGLVGAFIDGAQQDDICVNLTCPSNNTSHYFATLDDGYFVVGLQSHQAFSLSSMRTGFMGAGQGAFGAVYGLLYLQGLDQYGQRSGNGVYVPVAGPAANGQLYFANQNLGTFPAERSVALLVVGYACNAGDHCRRDQNAASFAFDDIVLSTDTDVPEPASWSLLGLALLSARVFHRKRAR